MFKKNENFKYYLVSILTFSFQILFISIAKEFKNEFIFYIQIISLSSLVLGLLGSLQFYIDLNNTSKKILINVNKQLIWLFIAAILIIVLYYLVNKPILSILFFTTFLSLVMVLVQSAIYARQGNMMGNSYLFFINNFCRLLILIVAYVFNYNFYYSVIASNIIIIYIYKNAITIPKFTSNNKKKFNFLSSINNFIGGSITSYDKLYASKYLVEFASNYYIIFRVASIFQSLTEIIFRKERFDITSYKINKLDYSKIYKKIYFCFFTLIILFIMISNINYIIPLLKNANLNFLISFFEILRLYKIEFALISLSFIINSIASLKYDLIYVNHGKNLLFVCNVLNFIVFFTLLVLFASSVETLCLIFFIIQVINFLSLEILNKHYKL
jgi:hypothetical protein